MIDCDYQWSDGWGDHACHLDAGHDGDHRCHCDFTARRGDLCPVCGHPVSALMHVVGCERRGTTTSQEES